MIKCIPTRNVKHYTYSIHSKKWDDDYKCYSYNQVVFVDQKCDEKKLDTLFDTTYPFFEYAAKAWKATFEINETHFEVIPFIGFRKELGFLFSIEEIPDSSIVEEIREWLFDNMTILPCDSPTPIISM